MDVYRYSLIRFRPFAETGEFANIGIIAMSTVTGEMAFRLAPRRFTRIRGFFDAAVHHAYSAAIESLRLELARTTEFLPRLSGTSGKMLFADMVERRESSIIFSEVRAIQGYSVQEVVERLFDRLVHRDFTVADTPEIALTKDIRTVLRRQGLKHFRSVRLADDVVPVTFPLAYRARELRAIRPLAFSQQNPLGIFDYGAHWRRRLEYLLTRGKITDGNVLIVVKGLADQVDDRMSEAYHTAVGELTTLPFEVVTADAAGDFNRSVVEFAEASIPPQLRLH